MKPAAVLFDLDDTLIDHGTALRHALVALAAAGEARVSPEEFRTRWKNIHVELYPRHLRGELPYVELSRERIWRAIGRHLSTTQVDDLFQLYMAEYRSAWRIFPDVVPCLDSLRHLKLGVISNGPSAEQRDKLRLLQIEDRFDYVAISEECGAAKPDARIFMIALDALNVGPSSAVFVGDAYDVDCLGASAAGLHSVWLDRASQAAPPKGPSIQKISSLNELREMLAMF